MITVEGRSLKSRNVGWLVALMLLDIVAMAAFVIPGLLSNMSVSALMLLRAVAVMLLPVVVLLLSGLLSSDVKAMLVFWKLKNVLPGHEAFSKHAGADSRIDLATLRRNVGAFPLDPKEQNAMWYRLYKKVGNDASVAEAHRMFLLFRDMSAVSILLFAIGPLGLWLSGIASAAIAVAAAMLFGQFLWAAIAARSSGVRFVTTVLALHSAKRVTASSK